MNYIKAKQPVNIGQTASKQEQTNEALARHDVHSKTETISGRSSVYVKSKFFGKCKDEGVSPSERLHQLVYNYSINDENNMSKSINEAMAINANANLQKENDMLRQQVLKQQGELATLRPKKGEVFIDGHRVPECDFDFFQWVDNLYRKGITEFHENDLREIGKNPWTMPNSGTTRLGKYLVVSRNKFFSEHWVILEISNNTVVTKA